MRASAPTKLVETETVEDRTNVLQILCGTIPSLPVVADAFIGHSSQDIDHLGRLLYPKASPV